MNSPSSINLDANGRSDQSPEQLRNIAGQAALQSDAKKATRGRVLTITSGKGGVGKTTTTANLAAVLSLLGHRVVCIDTDIGLRNLDLIMGLESQIVFNLVDIFERNIPIEDALIQDQRLPNLYLIPSAQSRDKSAVEPVEMVFLCAKLREMFDYILIDSPAGIEVGFKNAVAPADEIILVTTADIPAVRDADRVVGLLASCEAPAPQLIINRHRRGMTARRGALDTGDVLEILAVSLLGIVPEDEAVVAAASNGQPLVWTPKSEAGREYSKIAKRLSGAHIPAGVLKPSRENLSSFLHSFVS